MMYNDEMAFTISVCYGIRIDIANEMVKNAGNGEKINSIAKKDINRFMYNYDSLKSVINDIINKKSVSDTAKDNGVSMNTVKKYVDLAEMYYNEFKGFIELTVITPEDYPEVEDFMNWYGAYYEARIEKEEQYLKLFQKFKEGAISKFRLVQETGYTFNKLCDL